MHGLKALGLDIDRKMLAELAVKDAAGFADIAGQAKTAGQAALQAKTAPAKTAAPRKPQPTPA